MKVLSIIGMTRHLDKVVTVLGKSGVFHPDDALEFFSETEKFVPVAAKNESSGTLTKLKNIMSDSGIEPTFVDISDYHDSVDDIRQSVLDIENELGQTIRRKTEIEKEILECKKKIENSSHFVGLDLEMEQIAACEFIVSDFGRLPKESYKKLTEYDDNDFVQFFPISSDDKYYWGIYTSPVDMADEIDSIFSALYFEHCEVQGYNGTPVDFIEKQKAQVTTLENELSELNKNTALYGESHKEQMNQMYSKLMEQNAFHSILSHAYRYHKYFILAGWIPAKYEKQIHDALESIESVELSISDAKEEIKHNPPVKYKNNFISRAFEFYTDMYGTPHYGEVDPSGFIAFTYSLLFGIMFGDVGHGVILFIAALIMNKKGNALGKILIPCSVFSVIFGFIFGSIFGYEEVIHKWFGLSEKPIDVMHKDTMTIIYSAVGIGMLLVIFAMGLNIYSSIRRGDIGTALFGVNGISGFVFYTSLVIGLVCSMVLGIKIMTPLYIVFLIVLPLILVFLREPLSKLVMGEKNAMPHKWGEFFVDNFFELFEVCLSYVTNTMSFLRVGAFVLVHAGMMQVVFVLASMFGTIGSVITIIVGNLLVAALEALLVGIQVLRLEYYEMFSRFYIGDGRPYQPVRVNKD